MIELVKRVLQLKEKKSKKEKKKSGKKPRRKLASSVQKSFGAYKADAASWITLATGEYYPDKQT